MPGDGVRSCRNLVRRSHPIVNVVDLVNRLVVTVDEYGHLALHRRSSAQFWRFTALFGYPPLTRATGLVLRDGIERVLLFQRACTPGTVSAATDIMLS